MLANPAFPRAATSRSSARSRSGPTQWEIETAARPRLQPQPAAAARLEHGRDDRLRRLARLRICGAAPTSTSRFRRQLSDGTLFYPPTAARPNSGFSSIERKSSDGRSWYDAFVFELRRHRARAELPVLVHLVAQHRHHAGLDLLLRRHERHRLVLPGVRPRLQQGSRRLPHHAQLGRQPHLGPAARPGRHGPSEGASRGLADRVDRAAPLRAAAHALRRRQPLALALVALDRARARASTARASRPATRPRVPSAARPISGSTRPRSCCSRRGPRRPRPRRALRARPAHAWTWRSSKRFPWTRLGPAGHVELRVEAFNVFNRANFGIPSLQAFAGLADGEQPLPTLGRIRQTRDLGAPDPAGRAPAVLEAVENGQGHGSSAAYFERCTEPRYRARLRIASSTDASIPFVRLKAGPHAGMSAVPCPLTSSPLEMIRTTRSWG